MKKLLPRLIPLLLATAVHAQAAAGEPPTEKAGPFAVAIFILLFLGGCGAYFIYLWRTHKKGEPQADEPAASPASKRPV
jgi:hypothetical protein